MPKTARASSGRGKRCSWKRPSAGPPDGAAGSVVLDRTRTEALRKGRRSCEATYCNCSALARSARALLRTARAPRPSRASGGFLQKVPRIRYPFRSPLHTQTGLSIIPLLSAPVAQLDRVSGYEPEGRGFESCLAHHFIAKRTVGVFQASFLLSFENVQLFLSILLRRRRKEIHSPAKCLKFRQFSNQLISTERKGFSSVFFKVMHRFCGQHALEETSRSARGSGR